MNRCPAFLLLAYVSLASGQETFRFTSVLGYVPDPSRAPLGTGSFVLSGQTLAYSLPTGSEGFATIRVETNDAIILVLQMAGCGGEFGGCTYAGQAVMTQEQVADLKSGRLVVDFDHAWRGSLNLECSSTIHGSNAVNFSLLFTGPNPAPEPPPLTRWGRGRLGLTGRDVSYELRLPLAYANYELQLFDPIRPPLQPRISLHLPPAVCEPIPPTEPLPPDASGLETLPGCIVRGSVCLIDSEIAFLLRGELVVGVRAITGHEFAAQAFPEDIDGDGVPDFRDICPGTAPSSIINATGCSIEQLCPCDGPWENHAEFVNCMKKVTGEFFNAGLISESERRERVKAASRSDCGKPR